MVDAHMKQSLADALDKLAGRALSSVEFLADYVQLWFDGPCLTAYTSPTVASGPKTLSLDQPGYRDSLCRQIGCRVEHAEVDDRRVSICFEGGATISISLLDDDYRGPEALQFSLDRDHIWVA
jgi:hypothetical protein